MDIRSRGRRTRAGTGAAWAACALAVAPALPAGAATLAEWLAARDGHWTDPANWSTNTVPQNGDPPGTVYDVRIGARGTAYLVDNVPAWYPLNSITLASPDATLELMSTYSSDMILEVAGGVVVEAGTLRMKVGRLHAPTLSIAPGARAVVGNRAAAPQQGFGLQAVTLAGAVQVADNGLLYAWQGLTLAGATITLDSSSRDSNYYTDLQADTVGGTGEILLGGTGEFVHNRILNPTGTLRIGAGVTVRTVTQGGFISNDYNASKPVILEGAVLSETAGKTIWINGSSVANSGTLLARNGGLMMVSNLANSGRVVASNGATVSLTRGWTNTGSIEVYGGTLKLGGPAVTLAALGNYTNRGGVVEIAGTCREPLLELSAATGDWRIGESAELWGTRITARDGAALRFASGPITFTPVLRGVTLDVPATLEDWTSVEAWGALTLNRRLTMLGGVTGAGINLRTGALAGTGEIVFDGDGDRSYIGLDNGSIEPGFVIRTASGGGTVGDAEYSYFVNRGIVSARTPGRTLSVGGVRFTNEAVLEAIDGGTMALIGNWTNRGTIRLWNGTLNLGGTFTFDGLGALDRSGGVLNLTGTIDNAGRTLAFPARLGPWNLCDGGRVSGGVVTAEPGVALNAPWGTSTLDGVTLRAPVTVNGGKLAFAGNWRNESTVVLASGTVSLGGTFDPSAVGTIARSGGTVEVAGTMQNAGNVLALDAATGSWALAPGGKIVGGRITTAGGAQLVTAGAATPTRVLDGVALDGAIVADAADLTLQGGVTIGGALSIRSTTVTVKGGLALTGGQVQLLGAANFYFSGSQTLGGTGEVVFGPGSLTGSGGTVRASSGTLTIGPGVVVRGEGTRGGTVGYSSYPLVNLGTIRSGTAAGSVVTVLATNCTNSGLIHAAGAGSVGVAVALSGAGTLRADAGATLTVRGGRQAAADVSGTLALTSRSAGGSTLVLQALNIAGTPGAWSGTVELADRALVIDYGAASPLATIADQVRGGRAGGTWGGNGITSSTAAKDARYAVGCGEAADLLGLSGTQTASWQDQTVDATSVLVRPTLLGDATLDGTVGFADLLRLAQNYDGTGVGWGQGDFDYDGTVGFADLLAVAQNYGRVAIPAALPATDAGGAFEDDWARAQGLAGGPVPEPAMAAVAGIGLAAALGRRTRRPAGARPVPLGTAE